jgi:hypothetical protein
MRMMIEWPGRCSRCHEAILDWPDAGLLESRWIHKSCFVEARADAQAKGAQLPVLRSPADRGSNLEVPMLIFLLMFHFGLGFAVIGWILITQGSPNSGYAVLTLGIVSPLIGVAGVAANVISRRRIELVRRAIETQGGWRPGR